MNLLWIRSEKMMRAGTITTVVVAVWSVTSAGPAHSQAFRGFAGNLALSRQLMQPVDAQRMRANRSMAQAATARAPISRSVSLIAPVATPRLAGATTAYHASPAVSLRLRQQVEAAVARTSGPEGVALLRREFDGPDPVKSWAALTRENGLRPGDVSDAMAAYIGLNWAVANGTDIDAPATRALRDRLHTLLLANPDFARMNDAGRQIMAENLMMDFILQRSLWEGARRRQDLTALAKLGDASEQRVRATIGLDLRAIRLTSRGVVPKS